MLKIPYVTSPYNACALAGYTMVAKYFFPKSTFDQIVKISDWQPDYVIWSFKFWNWTMDKDIKITDYDLIDYSIWANDGFDALRPYLPKKEFEFYKKYSADLDTHIPDIKKMIAHPNFTQITTKPTSDKSLSGIIRTKKVGDTVRLKVLSKGKEKTVTATLEEMKS